MVMRCIAMCCIVAVAGRAMAADDFYDTTWRGKQVVLAASKDGVTYAMKTTSTGSEFDLIEVSFNEEGEVVYLTTESNQKMILWYLYGRSTAASIQSVSDSKYLYIYNPSGTPKLSKNSASSAPTNYSALKFDTKTRKTFYYKDSDNDEWGILMHSYAFKLNYTSYITNASYLYPIAKPYFLAEHTWRKLGTSTFGTICFPKAVRTGEVAGATFYEISAKIMRGDEFMGIVLKEVTGDLAAGTPYIFKKTGETAYIVAALNGEAVEANSLTEGLSDGKGLVGTLSGSESDGGFVVPAGKYILQRDQLWLTTEDQSRLEAGRAYIDPSQITRTVAYEEASSVKGFVLGTDAPYDGVTGIKTNSTPSHLFDLLGREVVRPRHGTVNVINGRKVVIK